VHESDEFWKENAIRLNEKDHEQLKYGIFVHTEPPTHPG
jgi:hypothetical protein